MVQQNLLQLLLSRHHNYHLMHHLFPAAPFYNYLKIWHLRYDEIIAHDPAIQKTFGLKPLNR